MRRVLVPLDGSTLAEAILPDARRLAGSDGELVLIRDANWTLYDPRTKDYTLRIAIDEADHYLQRIAANLRRTGVKVATHRQTVESTAAAIDEAALEYQVDMIACATHGRGPAGRYFSGSTVWRALANSPVPVMLQHPEKHAQGAEATERRILVPLDGSRFGETAVPLAAELAQEWDAPIWLVAVIVDYEIPDTRVHREEMLPEGLTEQRRQVRSYLQRVGEKIPCETHCEVLVGPPVAKRLINAVGEWGITDVVIASHGRTGLQRIILGSVADALVHTLHCPVIVVPALAVEKVLRETEPAQREAIAQLK